MKQPIDSDQGYFDRRRIGLLNDSKHILIFLSMPNLCYFKQKPAQLTPVSPTQMVFSKLNPYESRLILLKYFLTEGCRFNSKDLLLAIELFY